MTVAALRRTGFPEAWDAGGGGYYLTGIGSGDKRMTFGTNFGDEGLFSYSFAFFNKYRNELTDLLSNACAGPITLDNGGQSWVSAEGVIVMKDISNNRTSAIAISVLPFK
jgi:hypothetical protein